MREMSRNMVEKIAQGTLAGTLWNPEQYLKFSSQRMRPAGELLGRIPLKSPAVIYDLGCGSGAVTRIIAERWPSARVYGLDKERGDVKGGC